VPFNCCSCDSAAPQPQGRTSQSASADFGRNSATASAAEVGKRILRPVESPEIILDQETREVLAKDSSNESISQLAMSVVLEWLKEVKRSGSPPAEGIEGLNGSGNSVLAGDSIAAAIEELDKQKSLSPSGRGPLLAEALRRILGSVTSPGATPDQEAKGVPAEGSPSSDHIPSDRAEFNSLSDRIFSDGTEFDNLEEMGPVVTGVGDAFGEDSMHEFGNKFEDSRMGCTPPSGRAGRGGIPPSQDTSQEGRLNFSRRSEGSGGGVEQNTSPLASPADQSLKEVVWNPPKT